MEAQKAHFLILSYIIGIKIHNLHEYKVIS